MSDEGYSLAPWPGLSKRANGIDFQHDRVEQVAKALQTHVDAMAQNGRTNSSGGMSGSLYSLQYNGRLTSQELGKWPAAETFAQTVGSTGGETGTTAIEQLYGEYIQQYRAVVAAIRAGRVTLGEAEDASTTANPYGTA